jgi:hypothetical protein
VNSEEQSVHCVVISWPDFEASAEEIAASIRPFVDRLDIAHNSSEGLRRHSMSNVMEFGEQAHFGEKFSWAVQECESDVLLFIVADTAYPDWRFLVERCKTAFDSLPNCGIWAPQVDETFWKPDVVRLGGSLGGNLSAVSAVDSIVWAISRPVIDAMRTLDYTKSKFGWGIDVAAAAYAHSLGLLVSLDEGVLVQHRRGTSYDISTADKEARGFYYQLPSAQNSVRIMIEEHAQFRRALNSSSNWNKRANRLKQRVDKVYLGFRKHTQSKVCGSQGTS